MKLWLIGALASAAVIALSCNGEAPDAPGADAGLKEDAGEPSPGAAIPKDVQRQGDAAAGYTALVNNGYVTCGVPWSAYSKVFGPAADELKLSGRTGHNADLPYYYTAFTTASGVEVVTTNCLICHAGLIKGQVVIGLGAADGDFTSDASPKAQAAGLLLSDPAEKAEWSKWASRLKAVGPHTKTLTIGANPADNIAAVLFAHRDPKTLAWSDEPLLDLPAGDVVPVDVPPWWRMAKKNAMFYTGGGRGDHARIMMTASTLCTDSVAEAQAIDAYFPDIEAYIASIKPPAYPFPIDQALAKKGRVVFEQTCAKCHGTYGDGGAYPNLLIASADVGTDELLITGSSQFGETYVKWFNESFYGEKSRLDPQHGYVAPPLDGIWATAPFLHNGSVPTLAALLDSGTRPKFWTRTFDSNDYDPVAVGWSFTVLTAGQDAETDENNRIQIYDTTKPGYGSNGHVFGDGLSQGDRLAVIEYLKTL